MEYGNGYLCGCIIPDADAPSTGAPGDVLKFCEFVDHTSDPCIDDGHRMIIAEREWRTADEALDKGLVYIGVAREWFERHNFSTIMQDKKRYEKFKKLGEE